MLVRRFTAVLRALMSALVGTVKMHTAPSSCTTIGGIVWGIGYCLLGYLTGSAYAAIGRQIGAGFAIAIAALVVTALAIWAVRRYRRPAGVGREHRARLRLISRGARAPAEVRGGLWAMRPERAPRPWRIHLPGDDHAAHLSVSAWVQATTTLVVTWKCV